MAKINLWVYEFIMDGQALSVSAIAHNDLFGLRVMYGGKLYERRCFRGASLSDQNIILSKTTLSTGRLMGAGGELELKLNIKIDNMYRAGDLVPVAVRLSHHAKVCAQGEIIIGGRRKTVCLTGIAFAATAVKMPKSFAVYSALNEDGVLFGGLFADNSILWIEFGAHFCVGEAMGRTTKFGPFSSKCEYYDTGTAFGITARKGLKSYRAISPLSAESSWDAGGIKMRFSSSVPSTLTYTEGAKSINLPVKASYIVLGKVRAQTPQGIAEEEAALVYGAGR